MSIHDYIKMILAALCVCCVSCAHPKTINFGRLDRDLQGIITNRTTSDEMLLQCISRLGPVTESPGFWTQIADDTSYSTSHRSRAVVALFRRHERGCGDLFELSKALAPGTWMKEGGIEQVDFPYGWIPVEMNPGETVFRITVFYRSHVYIRLAGTVDIDLIRRYLRGELVRASTHPPLLQCGFDDDYDQWLRKQRSR